MSFSGSSSSGGAIHNASDVALNTLASNQVLGYDNVVQKWTNVATSSLNATASSMQATATYTFALSDSGTVVEGNSTASQTFTVPPASSVAWPTGTVIEIFQAGTGQIALSAGVGVTLQTPASLTVRAQYSTIGLRYRGSNIWAVSGDLT